MDTLYPEEWLTYDRIAELFSTSVDAARVWVKRHITSEWIRTSKQGKGRPKTVVHYSAHSKLYAAFEAHRRDWSDPTGPALETLDAADLTIAQLRMRAVNEYRLRKQTDTEQAAAAITCADWRAHPRRQTVAITERIGKHQRSLDREIEVGCFSESTLREWDRYFKGRVTDLLPKRKTNAGRKEKDIPEALLLIIYKEACRGPRACWSRAIKQARQIWSGPWPKVSNKTLIRRAREFDPEEAGLTQGRSGTSAFMKKHMPFIETDWNEMGLNDEWQIDDMDEDFYAFLGENAIKLLGRPVIYRIIRCSTRQVLATIASPCKITKAQVQALVGLALTNEQAGIPKCIRFERGEVACSATFEGLLNDFGIRVARTGMDGDAGEKSIGHSWGKPIVERSNRRHHEILWRMAGQIGTMERLTSTQRTQFELNAAKKHFEETGEQITYLQNGQWQQVIHQAEHISNTTPHSGLPLTMDLETGERRHMTPNEFALKKKETVQVLPESALPLFFTEGRKIPVDANGILLDNVRFGKFDDELKAFAPGKVTAYCLADCPDRAFILELGRSVEMYRKRVAGQNDSQFEKRQHTRKAKKNQYNELIARAEAAEKDILQVIDSTQVHATGSRPVETVLPEAAANRMRNLHEAKEVSRAEIKNRVRDFYKTEDDLELEEINSRSPGRKSLAEKRSHLSGQVAALTNTAPLEDEDDPFTF